MISPHSSCTHMHGPYRRPCDVLQNFTLLCILYTCIKMTFPLNQERQHNPVTIAVAQQLKGDLWKSMTIIHAQPHFHQALTIITGVQYPSSFMCFLICSYAYVAYISRLQWVCCPALPLFCKSSLFCSFNVYLKSICFHKAFNHLPW